MDVKRLFEGVDTSNIDIEKVEQLSKEIPDINKDMFSIEQEYESFYKEYEHQLSNIRLKNMLGILPLIDFSQLFIQTGPGVFAYIPGRGRARSGRNKTNSLIGVAVKISHFTEMPERIGHVVAHTPRRAYVQSPKRKYRAIKGVVPKRLNVLRKNGKKDIGKWGEHTS